MKVTISEYNGYLIYGRAVETRPDLSYWQSQGIVFIKIPQDATMEIQRLEGDFFQTKQAAEEDGLKLCKEWIGEQRAMPEDSVR